MPTKSESGLVPLVPQLAVLQLHCTSMPPAVPERDWLQNSGTGQLALVTRKACYLFCTSWNKRTVLGG